MKIAIIGAGVAGLSAGCYLRMNGFETEIFEMHSRSGGLCTNWQRGEYSFNGCINWLLGSNESNPFFKLWSELIDMSSIRFINNEIRYETETLHTTDKYGSKLFHLYTDLDRLETYMLDIAPEDRRLIRTFIGQVRRIQQFEIPPMVQQVVGLMSWKEKSRFIKHLPLLLFLRRYRKITNLTFARRCKNPFLKEAFQLLFNGSELPLLIVTMPLAFQDTRGAGYPIGGSTAFADKIEARYRSLGGILHFNSRVEKILVDDHKATGLLLADGRTVPADHIVSCADWNYIVFSALGGKYVNRRILALHRQKKLEVYYSLFAVFLGIGRSLKEFPPVLRFPLESTLRSPDGTSYDRMEVHIHHYDPTLAPEGKTVVSVSLYTRNGSYWIALREKDPGCYEDRKKEFAGQVIDILEKKIGDIKDHIEQSDVATPATFHRYTNNRNGSIQGWLPGRNLIAPSPVSAMLPGLKNFYLAGHWTVPGGGLPIAIKSARDVSMMICHETKQPFSVKSPAAGSDGSDR